MIKKIISGGCIFLAISSCSLAKEEVNVNAVYQSKDLQIFSNYVHEFHTQKDESMGILITKTGQFFSGKPYVASTLEKTEQEELIVNLTEFDCTTFLETSFALASMLKDDRFDIKKDTLENFDLFCQKLKEIRYRNGEPEGYVSRLHYFSDWIFCNERKGLVRDISKEIGGEKKKIEVNFMSTHPASYKQLQKDSSLVDAIRETEEAINLRTYYYVPKSKIKAVQSAIQDGDIIAFTTTIQGLDVSHVGFAVRKGNELHLLHASSTEQKVVISTQPLSTYTENVKRHSGVRVARSL